jgi:hypothetical protein
MSLFQVLRFVETAVFCVCIFFATYNLFEGYKIIAEMATLEVQNE